VVVKGRQVQHEAGIVNETIAFNVFIEKQSCSVANCGKMLQVHKATHAYGTTQSFYIHCGKSSN
jgi:hypothetical protein